MQKIKEFIFWKKPFCKQWTVCLWKNQKLSDYFLFEKLIYLLKNKKKHKFYKLKWKQKLFKVIILKVIFFF